jgi:quinol monooxygenase YgiN
LILVVATIRIQPDKIERYETACRELLPKVRADELGVVFYEVAKSREEPHTYRVVEVYRNEDALARHLESRFVDAAKPELYDCLAGEIEIKMHDTL